MSGITTSLVLNEYGTVEYRSYAQTSDLTGERYGVVSARVGNSSLDLQGPAEALRRFAAECVAAADEADALARDPFERGDHGTAVRA